MIAIIGSNGQLGWELVRQAREQGLPMLALDFPEISEVEVNPLLVLPEDAGAKVLDARMLLKED